MDKKEQTRIRVQRYRERQKSVTDVTQPPENVTQDVTHYPTGYLHIWKEGKKVLYDEVPEGYKVLSDGQLWKPDPVIFRGLS